MRPTIGLLVAVALSQAVPTSACEPNSDEATTDVTLDAWIGREALPFSLESTAAAGAAFDATVDAIVASLGDRVQLLGFGEALHGGEDLLTVRNRLFRRLVVEHGYRAIAVESSSTRAWRVNEYVHGRGDVKSYDELLAAPGFSQGVGEVTANRELVEWIKAYNADADHKVKVSVYGFDIPSGTTGVAGPGDVLQIPLDYLANVDAAAGAKHRGAIEALLAEVAELGDWENPAAWADNSKSVGLTQPAAALRLAIEDLVTELRTRRPEFVARHGNESYLDALQGALVARQVADFHAALARQTGEPPAGPRGIRDALMADNLLYVLQRERGRGKVFAFAHNGHLQRGRVMWPCCGQSFGPQQEVFTWWPAGSQLHERLGPAYAVIGSGVGESADNGIAAPEDGTLEARFAARPGAGFFIATRGGRGLSTREIAALPTRSGSRKNLTYTSFEPQSLTDFDYLCFVDSTPYSRGAPPLYDWNAPADTTSKPTDDR